MTSFLRILYSFVPQAVWVGTRFVCAEEAGAPPNHQKGVIGAGYHDTARSQPPPTPALLRAAAAAALASWETLTSPFLKTRPRLRQLSGYSVLR